ncbi:M13 family metallopeptidase [Solimonas marina]|uniref:M13 family metallopeptidase n=1 Tax=Solimonas marina TaxID=2714601 RepID=A0A970B4T6_9GAMM|nr:M13 family metallopeptidase [Solimonas marina]NKF20870.1 M13 family metallopeptidase [Solimonas marina]
MFVRHVLAVALGVFTVGAEAAPADVPTQGPLQSLPYTPSLDVSAMDTRAQACDNFYQYACGGWQKHNPIPSDQASWSVYGKVYAENQRFLWGILAGLSQKTTGLTADQQKLGDYFSACMNEAAVQKAGLTPINGDLARIASLKDKAALPGLIAALQERTLDRGFLFAFGSAQSLSDATQVIADVDRGGLGLPDRDYYFRDDAKSKKLRAQYVAHVQAMFGLLGDAPAVAKQHAATVMKIETALAKTQLTPVERRDPHSLDHPVDLEGLQALTPHFDWSAYLKTLGTQPATFNVEEPAYLTAMDAELATLSLADWQTYLRWHVAHANADVLPKPFVTANFDFYRKTLRGVPEQQPRWKRCVTMTDEQLGDALGREFVARTFSAKTKADVQRMTEQIEAAMKSEIETLDWMSDATKKKALEKLAAIVNKIGYPDHWRDYSTLTIARDDFAGNVARGNVYEARRDLAKIGKPVDRSEWGMTPPTVNAYYDPQKNDINFPAGVLQPPLYDPKMDAAPNYGNTGGTIGHELTHAFDDEGRQFDAQGNLKDWWTPADAKAFEKQASCVVDQYAQYTVVDDIKINSKLTEGEDLADLGGLVLAWIAWKTETEGQKLQPVAGLTPEQRFFIGNAQWACANERPEQLRAGALTDPHSPPEYRVNGLVVNMPQFKEAFHCKDGDKMVKEQQCRVW